MLVKKGLLETRANFKVWLEETFIRQDVMKLAWQSLENRVAGSLRAPIRELIENSSLETLCEQVAISVQDYSFFPGFGQWCRRCEDEADPYATYGVMESDFVGTA